MKIVELFNQLVRNGEGSVVLSTWPKIDDLLDPKAARFLQKSDRVPLVDAVRALAVAGRRVTANRIGRADECVVAVDRSLLQQLMVSAVYVRNEDRLDWEKFEKDPNKDWNIVLEAYDAAIKLATTYEKNRKLTAEQYQDALSKSPDPEGTRRFLADVDPRDPRLIGPKGPLTEMPIKFPATLPAGRTVELKVVVGEVRDRESIARVEIVDALDFYSGNVLVEQRGLPITLEFDREAHHREDLLIAQYLQTPFTIRATAECATDRRFAKQASLKLLEIVEQRTAIDKFHCAALQLQGELFDVPEQSQS